MGLTPVILARIKRGRLFEQKERRGWTPDQSGHPDRSAFEFPSRLGRKHGRIDVRLEWTDLIVLLELKSTDWNRPRSSARRQQLADIFNERCVQLVFRDER